MPRNSKTWRRYEELAPYILRRFADIFGISEIEAKQRVMGRGGTQWEIDAKGIVADGFLIVECKERTSAKLNKDVIAALGFKVRDSGAKGGIIITTIGLQKGAKKIAEQYDFKIVYLPKESTFEQYVASCGERIAMKISEKVNASMGLTSFTVNPPENK